MKNFLLYTSLAIIMLTASCSDNTQNAVNNTVTYNKVLETEFSSYNVKLFVTGQDSLTTGYNDIYAKVTNGSTEIKTGYLKIYPVMWMTPHLWHSTPASQQFTYDNSTGYFRGNIIFNMASAPPSFVWRTVITYHSEAGPEFFSDSVATYSAYHSEKQYALFQDSTEVMKYYVSLLKPYSPAKQLNDYWLIIYKSDDFETTFEQLTDPVVSISVFKADSLTQSGGNIAPVPSSDGIYRGKINIPYNGTWKVCDTIYYHGHYITNNPPPMPVFTFTIY